MRKFFLISLFATIGMVNGCGYGDGTDIDAKKTEVGDDGPLPQLAASCTSNADCKIGASIVGDCVAGVCRRFCVKYSDCEKDTICEAGVCQPVVDCPAVTLEDSSKAAEYKNRKCVKVFKVSPTLGWANLLKSDLSFHKENTELFGETSDFTSSNYTFELHNDSIKNGLNFSLMTYLAINYLKLVLSTATMAAQCVKPQWTASATGEYDVNGTYQDLPSEVIYSSPYVYQIADTPITDQSVLAMCAQATYNQNQDMVAYHNYLIDPAKSPFLDDAIQSIAPMIPQFAAQFNMEEEEIAAILNNKDNYKAENYGITADDSTVVAQLKKILGTAVMGAIHQFPFNAYKKMIMEKPSCTMTKNMIQLLNSLSEVITQIGLATSDSSSTFEGASAIYKWLASDLVESTILQTDFEKDGIPSAELFDFGKAHHEKDKDGNEHDYYRLGVFPVVQCDAQTWRSNVIANEIIRKNYQIQGIKKDYHLDKGYREFCSELDVGTTPISNISSPGYGGGSATIVKETFNGVEYGYDSKKSNAANVSMFEDNVKRSMLSTCVYMMNGTYRSGLMKAMAHSQDLKLNQCGNHEYLKEAMVDTDKMPLAYKDLFDLFEDFQKALAKISAGSSSSIGELLNANALYSKVADPSRLWLAGENLFPLVINNSTGEFTSNDLLMDIVFEPVQAMFEVTTNSQKPLTQDVKIYGYQESDVDSLSGGEYALKSNVDNPYISSFTYKNETGDSHGTLLYHRDGDGCPDGKCTLYWFGQKAENSGDGMICGGVSMVLKHIDGYIMLDNDKDFKNIGTRGVASYSE